MSGFPVFPKIETEFIDKWATQFIWHKDSPATSETSQSQDGASGGQASTSNDKKGQNSNTTWMKVGEGSSYTPSNDDIGSHIKIVATPSVAGRCGESVEISSTHTVNAGPGFCPFENRHLYTKKVAADDR
jgi:2',5'-phosphodiesterase